MGGGLQTPQNGVHIRALRWKSATGKIRGDCQQVIADVGRDTGCVNQRYRTPNAERQGMYFPAVRDIRHCLPIY